MKLDIILGLQWGDEGKGKIVDYLAPKYEMVARFQGGPNAGHTLTFGDVKHVLHQIPSGIFREKIQNIIGNGVVLDPVVFRREIEALRTFSIRCEDHLFISERAQLILPTHRLLDDAFEQSKGKQKIGSTLKGIGPTYQDKIARTGLRVGDYLQTHFREKYDLLKKKHTTILDSLNYTYDLGPLENEFFESLDFLSKFNIISTEYMINQALDKDQSILAEGAQGSLLDIDFGSYPFVTSSNTVAAGACTGLGVAPGKIGKVFGIFKAYCTRVGSGPFPTELENEVGERIREIGKEFGATTGRPRRCGWLDLPALKYAIMINGVTHLTMMKVDVLSPFDEIKVCTHYEVGGKRIDQLPLNLDNSDLVPVYKTYPGWGQDLDGISNHEDLPSQLLDYVTDLEKILKVPITLISTGPDRKQTILREEVTV